VCERVCECVWVWVWVGVGVGVGVGVREVTSERSILAVIQSLRDRSKRNRRESDRQGVRTQRVNAPAWRRVSIQRTSPISWSLESRMALRLRVPPTPPASGIGGAVVSHDQADTHTNLLRDA